MTCEVNGILVAAHELKQPLAKLRQLALDLDLVIDDPDDLTHIRDQMVDVSERALRQVNDLTKIAHLEEGSFIMEPVSARAVCDDVIRELAALYDFDRQDLDIQYTNKSPLVTANRDLLYSVIYNFCTNANHYPGDQSTSQITIRNHHDTVRIGVRDFGPALPTDIWRKLKQGWLIQPTTIPFRPGSSALGLYIASRFSEFMHADLGAVRHRDGTSFYIDLPISKQRSLFSL